MGKVERESSYPGLVFYSIHNSNAEIKNFVQFIFMSPDIFRIDIKFYLLCLLLINPKVNNNQTSCYFVCLFNKFFFLIILRSIIKFFFDKKCKAIYVEND